METDYPSMPKYPIRFDSTTKTLPRSHFEREPIMHQDSEEPIREDRPIDIEAHEHGPSSDMKSVSGSNDRDIRNLAIVIIIFLILMAFCATTQIIVFLQEPIVLFGGILLIVLVISTFLALYRRSIVLSSSILGFLLFIALHTAFIIGSSWNGRSICFVMGIAYVHLLHKNFKLTQTLSLIQQPTPVEQSADTEISQPERQENARIIYQFPQMSIPHPPQIEVQQLETLPQQISPKSPLNMKEKYSVQLDLLRDMGFRDETSNIEKLIKHNGHLQDVVNEYLSNITSK